MISRPRWNYCYTAREERLKAFIASHFDAPKHVLVVGGAGFDERATAVVELLKANCAAKVDAILFKEERPRPPDRLIEQARRNLTQFQGSVQDLQVIPIDIFSSDGNTVVGGRSAVSALNKLRPSLSSYSDVIIDFSAISIGVSFPVAKFMLELSDGSEGAQNLHLIVASCPEYDDRITALAGDVVTAVHGFHGNVELAGVEPARLWLPQLKFGQEMTLSRLHENIGPDDTCPILPFPAANPRTGDMLIDAYSDNLKIWEVDPRNMIYASENDPLDVYRTILRLCSERNQVFAANESLVVLSPVGSKVVGIGSLMAALENDLAIRYVEAENYEVKDNAAETQLATEIISIWLSGGPNWRTDR